MNKHNSTDADVLYITEECGSFNWRRHNTGKSIFTWYSPDTPHLVHPSILDQIVRAVFAAGYSAGLTDYTRTIFDDSDTGGECWDSPMQ